jgi:hypothetical protein
MGWEQSIHTFAPGIDNRCEGGWVSERTGEWVTCGSRQRSSVLHDDPESDFREQHYHGGGDCMCFEDPHGPDFYTAMRAYIQERG